MDKQIRQIELILHEQLKVNEELLTMVTRKREALAEANQRRLTDLCELENQKVQQLSELEKQRLMLVGQLTQAWQPRAAQPLKLTEIAEHLPEPVRGRLLVLRQQLRQKMEQVRSEAQVTRRVTESLTKHMRGLMQTISAACNGMASYTRRGDLPEQALAVSSFSTTA